MGHNGQNDQDQGGTAQCADQQGPQKVLLAGALATLDHEHAGDGQQNADTGHDHRGQDEVHPAGHVNARQGCTQSGGGENRATVALVEVGAHARDVANVVAHVVGDGCRVTRIVFRNARLDLTNQVGTDVGSLGVDTTTNTSEQCLGRSTHTECDHRGGNLDQLMMLVHAGVHEDEIAQVVALGQAGRWIQSEEDLV